MKAVADTLAVARSSLIERVARPAKPRRCYRKAGDEPLLVLIRRFVDERPTYGYRPHHTAGEPAELKASQRSMPSECCGSCKSIN